MLALVALRNLARNVRRTILSLFVIGVGITALVLTLGFVRFSFAGLGEAIVLGGLGHFEVAPADAAFESGTAERSGSQPALAGWRDLRGAIEAIAGVRGVGAAIQFAGVVTHRDKTGAALGVAVEPDRVRRMGMTVKVRDGSALLMDPPAEGQDQVLLGLGLARSLGALPGDTVVLMTTTDTGSLNAIDLRVAGLFTSGFQDLDARLLQVDVTTAARVLGTDKVSSLIVMMDGLADEARVESSLVRLAASRATRLSVVGWERRAPFYRQVRSMYLGVFAVLGSVIGLLVVLSVSNTLLMAVMERVREFGVLLAVGTSRPQLATLIVLEAVWLAVIGSTLGAVVAAVSAALINSAGIEMPPPPAAVDPVTLSLLVLPADYVLAGLFMTGLLALAAIPPIIRLWRIEVVEALAHV